MAAHLLAAEYRAADELEQIRLLVSVAASVTWKAAQLTRLSASSAAAARPDSCPFCRGSLMSAADSTEAGLAAPDAAGSSRFSSSAFCSLSSSFCF